MQTFVEVEWARARIVVTGTWDTTDGFQVDEIEHSGIQVTDLFGDEELGKVAALANKQASEEYAERIAEGEIDRLERRRARWESGEL